MDNGGLQIRTRFWPLLALLAAVALVIELIFLPRAGMEADELLFVTPYFRAASPLYSWHAGPWQIPVMIMDYIGALKSWLFWPIFHVWPPGLWSIRLPACLISVATLVIFGDLTRRVAGGTVALFSVLCLATDAPFLLTNVYDWGPVALLLLSTVLFLNLLYRYAESSQLRFLARAFLVAGAAVWFKAVFVFPLFAVLGALASVYSTAVRALVSCKSLTCAVVCFAAGASPLIIFNIAHFGATAAAVGYIGTASRSEKILMMRRTLDGRALEHYMFRSDAQEELQLSGAPLADLVEGWYRESRLGPGSALFLFLPLAAFALPFLKGFDVFRPLLFTWFASVGVFLMMLMFRDAGAGPHHTVLVYPGPHFVVAATLIASYRRLPRYWFGFALAGAGLIASNLYLLDKYYIDTRQTGFSVYWTDGSAELSRSLMAQHLPAAFLDWGIRDVVRVETGDRIILAPDEEPGAEVLYVTHCEGYVIDGARIGEFDRKATAMGFRHNQTSKVSDRNGRPVFCLFKLRRADP